MDALKEIQKIAYDLTAADPHPLLSPENIEKFVELIGQRIKKPYPGTTWKDNVLTVPHPTSQGYTVETTLKPKGNGIGFISHGTSGKRNRNKEGLIPASFMEKMTTPEELFTSFYMPFRRQVDAVFLDMFQGVDTPEYGHGEKPYFTRQKRRRW